MLWADRSFNIIVLGSSNMYCAGEIMPQMEIDTAVRFPYVAYILQSPHEFRVHFPSLHPIKTRMAVSISCSMFFAVWFAQNKIRCRWRPLAVYGLYGLDYAKSIQLSWPP